LVSKRKLTSRSMEELYEIVKLSEGFNVETLSKEEAEKLWLLEGECAWDMQMAEEDCS